MNTLGAGRYYSGAPYVDSDTDGSLSGLRSDREPGARRKKIAGYLKAANELRQAYQQSYTRGWGGGGGGDRLDWDQGDDTPGAFPDAAIVRSGDEEMVLFPSYARKHVKRKVSDNFRFGQWVLVLTATAPSRSWHRSGVPGLWP